MYPWKAVCGESRMHGLGWGEVIYVSSLSVLFHMEILLMNATAIRMQAPFERYVVYSDGRVWSDRIKGFAKQHLNNQNYFTIGLWSHNKQFNWLVHRLVATLFVPNSNPDLYTVVNHIDGDRHNNNYTNLEWCTQKQNLFAAQCQNRIPDRIAYAYEFINTVTHEHRLYSSFKAGYMDIFNDLNAYNKATVEFLPYIRDSYVCNIGNNWYVKLNLECNLNYMDLDMLTK
jgi:hypothetical protein